MAMAKTYASVTILGGGTGIYPVVTALSRWKTDISTVIAVSDSGGSTGRIRDEFGFPPVGDLRQSLAALAESEGQEWIRNILLYRFSKGNGLKGHNLGNLILTALQDMTGDTSKALEIAEKIFRLKGQVIPVTQDDVQLQITYQDGRVEVGEHLLDLKVTEPTPIKQAALVPEARLNPLAQTAITQSELVIIGPGDYHASLLATLLPSGIKPAFAATHAKVVYILNLMTRITQTHGWTARQHVAGIEEAIGRPIDVILVNDQPIPEEILAIYAKEGEYPVTDDLGVDKRVKRAHLLKDQLVGKVAYDTAHRSLLRHDSAKLERALANI